jgi:hypothetical protein
MTNPITKFQKECYQKYLLDIQKQISEFPNPYLYPDGKPIRPVLPVKTTQNNIMLFGAFPSARFERRDGMLIPVADNLSPFGHEEYFDGQQIRTQASRDSLDKNYFPQLSINPDKIWITDLVKVYLMPQKHLKNCKEISPNIKFVDTHKMFPKIAEESMRWMEKEIKICDPKLIITLGEVPARVISGEKKTKNKELLNGEIRTVSLEKEYKIAHLAHPEIRRINKDWDDFTGMAVKKLGEEIKGILG